MGAKTANPDARLVAALEHIAEVLEGHPAYMGPDCSVEDFLREGGDAATITELAYEARDALRQTTSPQ